MTLGDLLNDSTLHETCTVGGDVGVATGGGVKGAGDCVWVGLRTRLVIGHWSVSEPNRSVRERIFAY